MILVQLALLVVVAWHVRCKSCRRVSRLLRDPLPECALRTLKVAVAGGGIERGCRCGGDVRQAAPIVLILGHDGVMVEASWAYWRD